MNKKEQARAVKRIEVIKDVLKRLRYLKMSVYHYLLWGASSSSFDMKIPPHKQISKIEKSCKVCAKGALFLSHIRKYNKVSMDEVFNFDKSDGDCSTLDEFDRDNLDLVETAFEESKSFGGCNNDWNIEAAYEFGKKYFDDKERLRAILKNMLKNDGIFVPPPVQERKD